MSNGAVRLIIALVAVCFIVDGYFHYKNSKNRIDFMNGIVKCSELETQRLRNYLNSLKCADCRKSINDDDEARVCIQCGGRNTRIKI